MMKYAAVLLFLVSGVVASACSAGKVEPPGRLGCSPENPAEADNVRATAISHMIKKAVNDAAELHSIIDTVFIGVVDRPEPGVLTFVYDASPEFIARFKGNQPSVKAISTASAQVPVQQGAVRRHNVGLASGEICWSGPSAAVVRVSSIVEGQVFRSYDVAVARSGQLWVVSSVQPAEGA
jgi:hypothetical protein